MSAEPLPTPQVIVILEAHNDRRKSEFLASYINTLKNMGYSLWAYESLQAWPLSKDKKEWEHENIHDVSLETIINDKMKHSQLVNICAYARFPLVQALAASNISMAHLDTYDEKESWSTAMYSTSEMIVSKRDAAMAKSLEEIRINKKQKFVAIVGREHYRILFHLLLKHPNDLLKYYKFYDINGFNFSSDTVPKFFLRKIIIPVDVLDKKNDKKAWKLISDSLNCNIDIKIIPPAVTFLSNSLKQLEEIEEPALRKITRHYIIIKNITPKFFIYAHEKNAILNPSFLFNSIFELLDIHHNGAVNINWNTSQMRNSMETNLKNVSEIKEGFKSNPSLNHSQLINAYVSFFTEIIPQIEMELKQNDLLREPEGISKDKNIQEKILKIQYELNETLRPFLPVLPSENFMSKLCSKQGLFCVTIASATALTVAITAYNYSYGLNKQ